MLPCLSFACWNAISLAGGLLISKNWYLVSIDFSCCEKTNSYLCQIKKRLKLTLSSGSITIYALLVATILQCKDRLIILCTVACFVLTIALAEMLIYDEYQGLPSNYHVNTYPSI